MEFIKSVNNTKNYTGVKADSTVILSENENYYLKFLEVKDRDIFIKITAYTSFIPRVYKSTYYCDYFWNSVPDSDEQVLIIVEKNTGIYCGYCNVKNVNSLNPEIGIDLLPEFQGQGIGKQALELLLTNYKQDKPMEYFIAKVMSSNLNSQSLMAKLGAKPIGVEETEFNRIAAILNEKTTKDHEKKTSKLQFEDEYVLIYRIECK